MELAREIGVSSPSAVAQEAQQSIGEFTVARAISLVAEVAPARGLGGQTH